MRAVLLYGPGDMRVARVAAPAPQPGTVPVGVEVVGICGSDMHVYRAGRLGSAEISREPFVLGHEVAGRLLVPVPERELDAGALVAIEPQLSCGHCRLCRNGRSHLCGHARCLGVPPMAGGLAEILLVDPRQLQPVPESLGAERAALLEPLTMAMHIVDLAAPRWDESAAVLGCGPIGLLVLQLLRLAGCHPLFAIDPVGSRAEAALLFGADLPAADPETVLDATGREGVDLVVEATDSPLALAHAASLARRGGRVVMAGIPDGGRYEVDSDSVRSRELALRFVGRSPRRLADALDLLRSGRLELDPLVSHRVDLDYVPDIFARLARDRSGILKVLVHVGAGQ